LLQRIRTVQLYVKRDTATGAVCPSVCLSYVDIALKSRDLHRIRAQRFKFSHAKTEPFSSGIYVAVDAEWNVYEKPAISHKTHAVMSHKPYETEKKLLQTTNAKSYPTYAVTVSPMISILKIFCIKCRL